MTLINIDSAVSPDKKSSFDRLAELEWMIAKEWIGLVMQHHDKMLASIPLHQTRISKKNPNYWLDLSVSSWTLPNMSWDSYLVDRLRQIRKTD